MNLTAFSWPFVFALFLFVLNDHVLKTHFAGFLTGKISDFAAAFIIPAWLEVCLLMCGFKRRKAMIGASLLTVIALASIELSPMVIEVYEDLHSRLFQALHLPWASVLTADPHDLWALPVVLAYLWDSALRQENRHFISILVEIKNRYRFFNPPT